MMAEGAMVAICQFGGEFTLNTDGSMLYTGGEAHVVDIDQSFLFNDFKSEISSVLNVDISNMAIKYFLPANKRTLITVSCDKDLKRMIALNANSETFEFYVVNKPDNRMASVVADSGTSTVINATNNAVTPPNNRNAGLKKRAAGNTGSGRAAKSRSRLVNSLPPGASGIIDLKGTSEMRESASGEADTRDFPIDMDFPVVPISTATDIGGPDPCVVDALFDSGNGTVPCNAVGPYLPSPDDIIASVGQEFDNVKDFRDKLAEFAINKGFTYRFIKNEPTRLTVKCTGENCPWRLHASQLPRRKKFMIKRLNNTHTCGGCGDDAHRRVQKKVLVSFIKEKLRCTPDCKPKDIAEDIYREYGVNVNYFKIWRAKTDAEKELFNTHIVACNQLPWFCERILESNPGSVVTLATSADSRFRVFVSFHASLHGFEHGCRPLLILDRIPLKKSSQLRILVAAGVDGDDGIFPVAFSVVEEESYGSWLWFLEQLKYAVTTSRTITFISNRQNGLEEAVPQVFEDSFHSYCLIHLLEEFKEELKKGEEWPQKVKDEMVSDLECAAQACLVEDFNAYVEKISNVSKEAADWVIATKPEHWANALFRGQRYNHISADIVEFTDWILVKHESSALLMIDALRSKTMHLMHSRQEACSTWATTLTPTMELKLKKELSMAQKFDVLCSSDTVFEVRGRNINVVNIGLWECTCRRWQIIGLPCVHAIAVFDHLNKSYYDYCSRYFRTDCYRVTYSESVHQILEPERMTALFRANICPPPTRQLKWPRRKRDRRKQGPVRPLHCSRCKAAGHNKATCEAFS